MKPRKTILLAAVVVSLSTLAAYRSVIFVNATAANNRTLKQRAQQASGRLVITDRSYHETTYFEVLDLTMDSSTIVVGRTLSNSCKLSADERYVTTDYQVEVEEAVKGTTTPRQVITVRTPGGLKVFDDKTSALINVPDFHRPLNGRRYLFFLNSNSGNTFGITGGFQGAFELDANGRRILPSDLRRTGGLRQKYLNQDLQLLLEEVRLASQ